MIIVLVGSIGRFPVAGHAWVNLQYMLGFRALGHEVFYLEDCGQESYVYDWQRQEMRQDLEYPAGFIRRALEPFGFAGHWSYRAGERSVGMTTDAMRTICHSADLLLIRGAPLPIWRNEYEKPRQCAFLDVDPLFTQVKAGRGDGELRETVARAQSLFTIAQRIGAADCTIPDLGRTWHRTRSPVYLPEWPLVAPQAAASFTTIMQWSAYRSVQWQGTEYGNKQTEFPRFTDVARATANTFCVAMTGRPPEHVDTRGWRIIDGMQVSSTLEDYRRFIQSSFGEFAVAKQGYVASRGGWFSDRSVCYLASGLPVIVQDTGLDSCLPVGEGLLTFRTPEDAVAAVEDVQSRYPWHRKMARRIAEQYFDSAVILPRMLDVIGRESQRTRST